MKDLILNHNHAFDCSCVDCNAQVETKRPLVHLHLHTGYSTLDGAAKPIEYVNKAKEYGHPAIAITDHGQPAGILKFYETLKKNGVKPILGEEFYAVIDNTMRIPQRNRDLEFRDKHQSVFIANKEGYVNYNELNYLAFTEGYYFKPRITFEQLFSHSKGLIVTTGCAGSLFNQFINAGRINEAEEWLLRFKREFPNEGQLWVEIMMNEITDLEKFGMNQIEINKGIIKLANKHNLPIILTGDVHYANKDGSKLQNIVINVARGGKDTGAGDFLHAKHLYYHSAEDFFWMNKEFGYNYSNKFMTEVLDNTLKFQQYINFDFDFNTFNYPKYKNQDIKTQALDNKVVLKKMALKGLSRVLNQESFTEEEEQKYYDQLMYELDVINTKGYESYFLLYQDIVNHFVNKGHIIGCGRGSAAGSLLSYVLNITTIDPIKHGLYFDRFLNNNRNSPPDIDSDWPQGLRSEVVEYLKSVYGNTNVIGVGTHMIYQIKSAFADVLRGLGEDVGRDSIWAREITKLPRFDEAEDLTHFFAQRIEKNELSQAAIDWLVDKEEKGIFDLVNSLTGQCRQIGTHAGGIVVTEKPLWNYIPVTRAGKDGIVSAFSESDGSDKHLSALGLLKLDILGLSTLNILKGVIDLVKLNENRDITNEITKLNLDDPKLFQLFKKGNNFGIFQMEKIDGLLKEIPVDCFEDISALNAINRPGPLEIFGKLYGKWKKMTIAGDFNALYKEAKYPKLDFMRKATEKSYGCLIYQEQLMQMLVEGAGFNLGEADDFRRVVTRPSDHPKYYEFEIGLKKVTEGMIKSGYNKKDVDYFIDYVKGVTGYSFCLSYNHTVNSLTRGTIDIGDVKIGEQILCYDVDNKEDVYNEVSNIFYNGKKELYKVTLDNGKTIECTLDHKLLCDDDQMRTTNLIFSEKLNLFDLSTIISLDCIGVQDCVDLEINHPDHNYYANGVVVSNCRSHSICYAYIAAQCLYAKCYYKEYFYASLLNYEDKDNYQSVINDAIANNVKIKAPSFLYSNYESNVVIDKEGNKILYLGFKMIDGFGESAWESIKDFRLNNPNPSMETILSYKYKKLNGTNFDNLVKVGAFDDFDEDRNRLLKSRELFTDERIEKWFSFKQAKLRLSDSKFPESLKQNFDTYKVVEILESIDNKEDLESKPWLKLILKLLPYLPVKRQSDKSLIKMTETILGISLTEGLKFKEMELFLQDRLGDEFDKIKKISNYEKEDPSYQKYYAKVVKADEATTSTGKIYWKLRLHDGKKELTAMVWDNTMDFQKGQIWLLKGKLDDKYGTFNVKVDNTMTCVNLEEFL